MVCVYSSDGQQVTLNKYSLFRESQVFIDMKEEKIIKLLFERSLYTSDEELLKSISNTLEAIKIMSDGEPEPRYDYLIQINMGLDLGESLFSIRP